MSEAAIEPVPETDPSPPHVALAAEPEIITGIDLSGFQNPRYVDWGAIRRAGHRFAILRATYGTHPDAFFKQHVAGARGEGLAAGGYAFFRQTQPVDAQRAALVQQYEAAGLGCGDIAPAIDLEPNDAGDGAPQPALYNSAGREFVESTRAHFGNVMTYIAPYFHSAIGHPAWVLEHPVWTSQWTHAAAPVWPKDWAMWQFTNNYRVPIPRALRATLQIDESRARSLPLIP